jgi:4-amino-4-deoxy-L-arabinose transferase-like glycosyltransferase
VTFSLVSKFHSTAKMNNHTQPQSNSNPSREPFLWRWGVPLLIFVLALALYVPGIDWGLPAGDAPGKTIPWGADEIAPMGPLIQVQRALQGEGVGNSKYPLFHFIVLAGSNSPYLLFLKLTGALASPGPGYPYGFKDPVAALHALTIIARLVSLLMAAGMVIAVYFTAKKLWNRAAGVLAGVFTLLMYPMNYYGKMSNVDVPSLFWASLVFLIAADVLRDGWSVARANWMGAFAALSIATKDQSYAVLLLLPFVLLAYHTRALKAQGVTRFAQILKAPAYGFVVSCVVYVLTSGLALSPSRFKRHLDFILDADVQGVPSFWYYRYDQSLSGYLGLFREVFQQIVDTQGWILFVAGCAGIVLCWMRDRSKLIYLLPVPVLLLGVILPVRHTAIRFLLPVGLALALYAAYLLAHWLQAGHFAWRAAAVLIIVAGCGLQLWRAFDLHSTMKNDSRLLATAWLAQHVRPGDRVEYFELPSDRLRVRIHRLPQAPAGAEMRNASAVLAQGGTLDGQFVITQGPDDQSFFWFCSARVYYGLLNGSLGYEHAATIQAASRFSHEHLVLVNPRVQIFVRRDHAARIGLKPEPPPRP